MSAKKYATLHHHYDVDDDNDDDDDDDNKITTRILEHKVLLQKIDHKDILSDSCCEICACDCYTQRSIDATPVSFDCAECDAYDCNNNNNNNNEKDDSRVSSACSCCKEEERVLKSKRKKYKQRSLTLPRSKTSTSSFKRSSSASSSLISIKPVKSSKKMARTSRRSKYMRDCEILQDLNHDFNHSTSLPSLQQQQQPYNSYNSKSLLNSLKCKSILPVSRSRDNKLQPLKLCTSMSTLCLQPNVRQAFEQVPEHDQKIINRMAAKRSEQLAAKENAWLARRFWENERYERELMKCEQMEEFKQAVKDKQFKDYMMTKARLQELAQRDLEQLQQLRASLQLKDHRTRKRLESLSIERELKLQQRRCEELRKMEAVSLQQEEQEIGENLRRQNSCERLHERLKRAQHARIGILDTHLRRLRHDNEVAQLLHEEHWRENMKLEQAKQEQLKDQICRKRWRTQKFTKNREKRNEALAKTAKLSASLRELVRTTVGPDAIDNIKYIPN